MITLKEWEDWFKVNKPEDELRKGAPDKETLYYKVKIPFNYTPLELDFTHDRIAPEDVDHLLDTHWRDLQYWLLDQHLEENPRGRLLLDKFKDSNALFKQFIEFEWNKLQQTTKYPHIINLPEYVQTLLGNWLKQNNGLWIKEILIPYTCGDAKAEWGDISDVQWANTINARLEQAIPHRGRSFTDIYQETRSRNWLDNINAKSIPENLSARIVKCEWVKDDHLAQLENKIDNVRHRFDNWDEQVEGEEFFNTEEQKNAFEGLEEFWEGHVRERMEKYAPQAHGEAYLRNLQHPSKSFNNFDDRAPAPAICSAQDKIQGFCADQTKLNPIQKTKCAYAKMEIERKCRFQITGEGGILMK